jgi:predicted ferric reductase
MKKIILSAMAFMMLFSCQNDQTNWLTQQRQLLAGCASQEVLAAQLAADLAIRIDQIEAFTQAMKKC